MKSFIKTEIIVFVWCFLVALTILLFSNKAKADGFFVSIFADYKAHEIGYYENKKEGIYDDNASFGAKMSNGASVGYYIKRGHHYIEARIRHSSQLMSGKPFNDEYEYWMDTVGFEYKYYF